MARSHSQERRPYRDSSPITPLSPLSPSLLPQWLRHSRPRTGALTGGRIRLIAIAAVCIVLGWMITSGLGPGEYDAYDADEIYDTASGGILDDPTGFGKDFKQPKLQDGIIGEDEPANPMATAIAQDKELSVTGALADLHDAVKGKIQAWNPYASKTPRPTIQHGPTNATTPADPQVTNATSVALGEDVKDGITEDERLGARVRIGKCTILFNGNSFWERAIRTHEQHDRQHGYRLHVLRQPLMDDVWSKPAYILSLLLRELSKPESDRLEWLFWVDADTVILNPHIPIDVFLPPPGDFDDVHLMYSNDWNGLNNGVFPVRVNQWSVELFSAIVSFRHYRPDIGLTFRDQSAMDMLMKEPRFINNIVEAPQRWFNAYQGEHNETLAPFQIRRGDFLVHFAGVPFREERMGYWLDRAEQHLDDWEIPVKSTSYPQEVRDFWNEQRGLRQGRKNALEAVKTKGRELVAKIDQEMSDYGDRLTEDQTDAITAIRDQLNGLVDNGNDVDPASIEDLCLRVSETAQPLTLLITTAQKQLLSSAHDAIFAAEKDMIEQSHSGASEGELALVREAVENLKQMVMTPQEHWNRHDIVAAINAVSEARSRIGGSLAALSGLKPIVDNNAGSAQVATETAKGVDVFVTADPVIVIAEATAAAVPELEALPEFATSQEEKEGDLN